MDPEALARLHVRATKFVEQSQVLRELLDGVQAARGRLYFWREPDNLMARVTPLDPRSMLLEAPRGDAWTEVKRGMLATVLKTIETDTKGAFHGLVLLAAPGSAGDPPAICAFAISEFHFVSWPSHDTGTPGTAGPRSPK